MLSRFAEGGDKKTEGKPVLGGKLYPVNYKSLGMLKRFSGVIN